MLYNTEWKDKTIPTVEGLVAWLETKNPDETYQWSSGNCAIGQYLCSLGYAGVGDRDITAPLYLALETNYNIGYGTPHTFGAALQRGKKAVRPSLMQRFLRRMVAPNTILRK